MITVKNNHVKTELEDDSLFLPPSPPTESNMAYSWGLGPDAHSARYVIPSEFSKREASGYARPSFISSKGLKSPKLRAGLSREGNCCR